MTKRLQVFDVVKDIQIGLTDEQLMEKYNLSCDTLREVLDRLASAYASCCKEIDVEDES